MPYYLKSHSLIKPTALSVKVSVLVKAN